MRGRKYVGCVLLAIFLAVACGKTETPEKVIDAYVQLIAELEEVSIEEAIARLEEFQEYNSAYSISNNVADELTELRKINPILKKAQEKVEQGELEEAEKLMADLKLDFPDRNIARLKADLYLARADRLVEAKKYNEAKTLLKLLPQSQLTIAQIRQKQRISDAIFTVRRNQQIAETRAKMEQRNLERKKRMEREANKTCCCLIHSFETSGVRSYYARIKVKTCRLTKPATSRRAEIIWDMSGSVADRGEPGVNYAGCVSDAKCKK